MAKRVPVRGEMRVRLAIFLILNILFLSPASVFSAETDPDPLRQSREYIGVSPFLDPSTMNGAFVHEYPIAVPPGRNGVQPDLKLTYSSQDKRQDSFFGYGWSINIPYIERLNKLGSDKLYNQNATSTFYYSSISGELLPVQSTTTSSSYLSWFWINHLLAGWSLPLSLTKKAFATTTDTGTTTTALFEEPLLTIEGPISLDESIFTPEATSTDTIASTTLSQESTTIESIQTPQTATTITIVSSTTSPQEQTGSSTSETSAVAQATSTEPIATTTVEVSTTATDSAPLLPVTTDTSTTTAESAQTSSTSTHPVTDAIKDKSAKERATLKGKAIAEMDRIERTERVNYAIEVESMEPIDGGVQVFVRAWDKSGRQIGFGSDGTVEIERFRIFNPPILAVVPDGDILHEWIDKDTGERGERRLREDPKESLLQTLEHTLSVMKNIHSSDNVVPGKIGRTTSTFYPSSGENSPVDGGLHRQDITPGGSWSDMRGGSGNTENDSLDGPGNWNMAQIYDGESGSGWNAISRSIYGFDTSSLSGQDVQSATFSINGTTQTNGYSGAQVVVDRNVPQSTSQLATSDFDLSRWDSVEQSSTRISVGSWNTSGYNDFTLNATGTSNINKTGYSWYGLRHSFDFDNSEPSQTNNNSRVIGHSADYTGTTQDPKLVIEHVPSQGPLAPTNLLVNGLTNPSNIATTSPYFSAIHANASSTALAASYQIQISTTTSFTSTLYWNSGKLTLSSSTPMSQRTPNIYATTTFALDGTKYYWRIKLWDQLNSEGSWSTTTDYFITKDERGYRAKVDNGDMHQYVIRDDGGWDAYDKRGNRYVFGSTTLSRINNGVSTTTFRWMLDSITDPNGNIVRYHYWKDGGQVYPTKITYTGTDTSSGIFEIEFLREARNDIATSSAPGYSIVTKYRINEVVARVNGEVVRSYQIGYQVGNNGLRSLLKYVEQAGNSGSATTTLPRTIFGYSTTTSGWTENLASTTQWVLPSSRHFADSTGADGGGRVFDLSGDALPDLMWNTPSYNNVYKNTGTTWSSTSSTTPLEFDSQQRFGDVNGDGYLDMLRSHLQDGNPQQIYKAVYLGGPGGFVSETTKWNPPVYFTITPNGGGALIDEGVRLADVNGDGLADLVGDSDTFINNGTLFIQDSSWSLAFPSSIVINNRDAGVRILDVNGDGLSDVVVSRSNIYVGGSEAQQRTYLNTGSGWTHVPSWTMPFGYFIGTSEADRGARFADINGDSLPDVVGDLGGYLNTGSGWATTSAGFPTSIVQTQPSSYSKDLGVVIDDIDGDGLPDVIKDNTSEKKVWIKDGNKSDFLTRIEMDKGATTTISYRGSPEFREDGNILNIDLPIHLDLVESVVTDPGFGGAVATTTYSYRGGRYYAGSLNDRKFAGFASTTKTNSLGHTTRTAYHQGNASLSNMGEYNDHIAKIGKPYSIELFDSTTTSANLYSRTINAWARADYGDGRNFVRLWKSLTQTFDGDSSHRDTAETRIHDTTTGNLIELATYGEVSGNADGTWTDVGGDRASTTLTFSASSTNSTMSLPSRELVVDQSGNTIRDSKWYYDDLSLGSVSKGNRTKEERLISGSTYASTTSTYNSYGLITLATDPRGGTTTYAYDTHNLYPGTTTNALGYSRVFTYDYSSGKVATTTDENGRMRATDYDGLDRPIREKIPDFTTPSTLVLASEFTYTDSTSTPSSMLHRNYLTSATATDLYTYIDGLGRTIQTRKEAESANTYAVVDMIHDAIGKMGTTSLPYFNTGSARTIATTTNYLLIAQIYDPASRVKTVADVFGTTTNIYSDWLLRTTDPMGNHRDFIKDAYGNLATTTEKLTATTTATTTYAWNLNGKLTKLTDALGNVRNFTYDNLGRLLTSEDLHAVGDPTFGTTTYSYDAAGNLTQKITPRLHTINYTYDVLNRQLTENYTGSSDTEASYTYDTCENGVGRLCRAAHQSHATTTYAYNPVGLVKAEGILAVGTTTVATTSFTHLRNSALEKVTYPDNALTEYLYNTAGLLERVTRKEASGSPTNVVSKIDYAPTEQATVVEYLNGIISTSTLPASQKYRLSAKLTKQNGVGALQDFAYTYDAVGNITAFSDSASTSARKSVTYVYDTLYRLTSASTTATATGTASYLEQYTYNALGNLTGKGDLSFVQITVSTTVGATTSFETTNGSITPTDGNTINGTGDGSGWSGNWTTGGNEDTEYDNAQSADGSWSALQDTPGNEEPDVVRVFSTPATTTGRLSFSIRKNKVDRNNNGIALKNGSSMALYVQLVPMDLYNGTGGNGDVLVNDGTTATVIADNFQVADTWYAVDIDFDLSADTYDVYIDDVKKNSSPLGFYAAQSQIDRISISTGASQSPGSGDTPGSKMWIDNIVLTSGTTTSTSTALVNYYQYGNTGYANPHAPTTIGSTTLSYDQAGNLTQTTGLASTTLTWDYHHWLTQMGTGTQTLSYAYNHTGQRVKMATSSGATPTFYVGKYYETTGNTKTKHIYDDKGTLLASIETVGVTTTPYYIHTDHLGGTNIVTDANGTATQTLDYLPFGSKRVTSNQDVTSREYIGEVFDESTQLSYLNARYYDGGRGQFISQDPLARDIALAPQQYGRTQESVLVSPQELNTYSYAVNNPVNKKDPLGLSAAGVPLTPGQFFFALLFSPVQGSYDPVYESQEYSAQHSSTNQILGAMMNMNMGGGGSTAKTLKATQTSINAAQGATRAEARVLYHYTTEKNMTGILESKQLNPSLQSASGKDAFYGSGQYVSDIAPGTKSSAQLSRAFIGNPFQVQKYTNYVAIDVSGLNVSKGRDGVYVMPNSTPLSLEGRIKGSGKN